MPPRSMLTSEDCLTLAWWWAQPVNAGSAPPTFKSLAERAERELTPKGKAVTAKMVERAVRREFERHHYQVISLSTVPEPVRNGDLERELQKTWADKGVQGFIVIESRDEDHTSDFIHSQLGYAISKHLYGQGFFSSHDRIGVGSGRAVHATVNGFTRFDPTPLTNMSLMSLTGGLYPNYGKTNSSTIVDADSNVVRFIPHFADITDVKLMASQISYSDKSIEEEKRKRWINIVDELYGKDGEPLESVKVELLSKIPNCTFVGVGVFHKGHRLYDYIDGKVKGEDTADDMYFSSIMDMLISAYETCNRIFDKYNYVPLADICNRFFAVDAPQELRGKKDIIDARQELFDLSNNGLNVKLMTAPKTMLRHVPRNVLIAGTANKANAIRTMLEINYVPFKYICVNENVAELLRNQM